LGAGRRIWVWALGSGFEVKGAGFRDEGWGLGVHGTGYRVQGSGCRLGNGPVEEVERLAHPEVLHYLFRDLILKEN